MTGPRDARSFAHVETWVFDLDNTLYPADCNLFAQIDRRMGEFIANAFDLPLDEAQKLRQSYYVEHGTTLAGLMRLHDVCPNSFLDYVHDIDLDAVRPAPALGAAIDALPGRKLVFTNGSRKHAEAVAGRLGLLDRFEDIFDIHALDYIYPKPSREAYDRFIAAHGVAPASAAMFDDLAHNLEAAHALGMTTVLVDCRTTQRPEHQASADWTELPAHIHHRTEALAPFLAAIGAALAAETNDAATARQPQAQFCLT
ncbi:pyrimidine 5'-nucleotidase [Methyloceanibacter superfactus]|jgi:putative hydrolase of the HAD superfamily|uniref:pyrimidine 5'-nucleotidase n=1 Tax=Methyloceanibacter superfactus TaxID=1774969 RepID=UPI000849BDCE|nr:pyrimidine 5'-nucleotidase [Methyloceanibacter superfactus]